MRILGTFFLALIAVFVLVAVVGFCLLRGRGFSATEKPSAIEAFVALRLRNLAMPAAARSLQNPVPVSDEALGAGREHFAEHCADCHGKDGSGKGEIGENLYPPVPDMRLDRTQALTDGELFYIIQNGVPFTGMPGWGGGDPEQDEHAWHLVQFVRHLPKPTVDELADAQNVKPEVVEESAHLPHHEHGAGK